MYLLGATPCLGGCLTGPLTGPALVLGTPLFGAAPVFCAPGVATTVRGDDTLFEAGRGEVLGDVAPAGCEVGRGRGEALGEVVGWACLGAPALTTGRGNETLLDAGRGEALGDVAAACLGAAAATVGRGEDTLAEGWRGDATTASKNDKYWLW